MAKAREIKRRIRSVENTRQITRTMEMVATSRLKRARDRVTAARPYAAALAGVIGDLYTSELAERFALLRQPAGDPERVAVVLMTSNRGLCGAFNGNLIRMARQHLEALRKAGAHVDLHLIGKKGVGYFKYVGETIVSERIDIGDRPTPEHAIEVSAPLMDGFARGDLDAVDLIYGHFKSSVSTPPQLQRMLPVAPPEGSGTTSNYLLKPSAEGIVDRLLPLYVRNQVFRALVETAAAEQAARRVAMKNATDNASDILTNLTRTYNRARQAQITQEISEIVGGAEALQG